MKRFLFLFLIFFLKSFICMAAASERDDTEPFPRRIAEKIHDFEEKAVLFIVCTGIPEADCLRAAASRTGLEIPVYPRNVYGPVPTPTGIYHENLGLFSRPLSHNPGKTFYIETDDDWQTACYGLEALRRSQLSKTDLRASVQPVDTFQTAAKLFISAHMEYQKRVIADIAAAREREAEIIAEQKAAQLKAKKHGAATQIRANWLRFSEQRRYQAHQTLKRQQEALALPLQTVARGWVARRQFKARLEEERTRGEAFVEEVNAKLDCFFSDSQAQMRQPFIDFTRTLEVSLQKAKDPEKVRDLVTTAKEKYDRKSAAKMAQFIKDFKGRVLPSAREQLSRIFPRFRPGDSFIEALQPRVSEVESRANAVTQEFFAEWDRLAAERLKAFAKRVAKGGGKKRAKKKRGKKPKSAPAGGDVSLEELEALAAEAVEERKAGLQAQLLAPATQASIRNFLHRYFWVLAATQQAADVVIRARTFMNNSGFIYPGAEPEEDTASSAASSGEPLSSPERLIFPKIIPVDPKSDYIQNLLTGDGRPVLRCLNSLIATNNLQMHILNTDTPLLFFRFSGIMVELGILEPNNPFFYSRLFSYYNKAFPEGHPERVAPPKNPTIEDFLRLTTALEKRSDRALADRKKKFNTFVDKKSGARILPEGRLTPEAFMAEFPGIFPSPDRVVAGIKAIIKSKDGAAEAASAEEISIPDEVGIQKVIDSLKSGTVDLWHIPLTLQKGLLDTLAAMEIHGLNTIHAAELWNIRKYEKDSRGETPLPPHLPPQVKTWVLILKIKSIVLRPKVRDVMIHLYESDVPKTILNIGHMRDFIHRMVNLSYPIPEELWTETLGWFEDVVRGTYEKEIKVFGEESPDSPAALFTDHAHRERIKSPYHALRFIDKLISFLIINLRKIEGLTVTESLES